MIVRSSVLIGSVGASFLGCLRRAPLSPVSAEDDEHVPSPIPPAGDATSDEDCAICTLPCEHDVATTRCNHVFHRPCLLRWLERDNSCPTCRQRNPLPDYVPPIPCTICQEAFTAEDDDILTTRCNHSFHRECITQWLNEHNRCPNCNRNPPRTT